MTHTNQSFSFTQGGQTQIHKLRMLKQVMGTTFHISFIVAIITFLAVYFYNHHWSHILMYPFWALAEFMESLRGIFKHMKGFTFWVNYDTSLITRCGSEEFLRSPYSKQFISLLNQNLITALLMSFLSMILTFFISIFYFTRKGKTLKKTQHLNGLEVKDLKGYKKTLKANKVKTSLMIDEIPYPYDVEVKHMMVSGTTGSGKSNMMNHLLKAIRERGDKAVIVDTTGGFVEKFYDPNRDVLLNPFDKRSTDWCLWSEPLNQVYEFEDMAESLIPQNLHGDPFWTSASRQMVSESLKYAKYNYKKLSDVFEILMTKDIKKCEAFFKGTSISALFSKDMEKTMLSVRATLATYLKSLLILKDNDDGFSIDSWVKNENQKGFLFIAGVPKQRAQLRSLWSIWFNIAIKAMMDLKPNDKRRVWFIVDELSSLNKLPSIDMALAEGRKYGACLVLGFQNFAQIQGIYGVQGSKSMSELMVSKFMFKAVDHDNALLLSKMFGNKTFIEPHENISYGANEIRDGVNVSHNKRMEPLVPPERLMHLDPLQFYAMVDMSKVCLNASFSYYGMPSVTSPFDEVVPNLTIGEILRQKGSPVLDEDGGDEIGDDKTAAVRINDLKSKQDKEITPLSFDQLKQQLEKNL
jgi:type IV conjugative transfer system coupling protein TraD